MTTTVLEATATVRELLFGPVAGDSTTALTGTFRKNGTIASQVRGPVSLTAVVEREMATTTDKLLSLNLADVATAGWTKYQALQEAARRSHNNPTDEELVALATHTIESSHRPTIELFVNGRSTATFQLELQLSFTVDAALAVVQQAWMTELRTGTCTVRGSLSMQQTPVAERRRQFDLRGAIRLRHGIPLLRPDSAGRSVGRSVSDDARTGPIVLSSQ